LVNSGIDNNRLGAKDQELPKKSIAGEEIFGGSGFPAAMIETGSSPTCTNVLVYGVAPGATPC
jgi:hypothetical protein